MCTDDRRAPSHDIRELVVISGKGGTGKTSLLASYAALSTDAVIADCDVDAPDLHLLLSPSIQTRELFVAGRLARIKPGLCSGCGRCETLCRFDAVRPASGRGCATMESYQVDPAACEGCGVCVWSCPERAIAFEPVVRGEWYLSATRFGPLLHARLNAPAASSGKLVTTLREEARRAATASGRRIVLVDGSPGIGCPVIASITGASLALVVTEATPSGEHDMHRVLELAARLGVPAAVCVNRADLEPDWAERIERRAGALGALILPRVPFDRAVVGAQHEGRTVVERGGTPAAQAIERGWGELSRALAAPAHARAV